MTKSTKFSVLLLLLSILNLTIILVHQSVMQYTVEMFTEHRLISNFMLRGIVYVTYGLLPFTSCSGAFMILKKSGRNKYVVISIVLSLVSIYLVYFQTGITMILY